MDVLLILSSICISLFTLLGVFLLFTRKGNLLANKLLGLFFILWGVDFLDGILMLKGFYLEYPNMALWTEPFILLYGPLIYMYTRNITDVRSKLQWRDVLHLILWLLGLWGTVIIYHAQSEQTKLEIIRDVVQLEQSEGSMLVIFALYVHFLIYIFASRRQLIRTINTLEEYYATHPLNWMRKFLKVLVLVLILSIISSSLQFGPSRNYFEISLMAVLVATTIAVSAIILKALDSPAVLLPPMTEAKYAGEEIPPEDSLLIAEKITLAMREDKLFLNPDLNLQDLSEAIGESRRKVSQVINDTLKTRFFDLINNYRIEAARELLINKTDPGQTILEIMYAVGFNSKSSFNTQFKKKVGLTPSEFIRVSASNK